MARRGTSQEELSCEELLAQDRLLFMVQTTMQRLLNDQGLKARDLARRLDVSEARISQLFSDDASNMTIKTIARVFHHLNAKPLILSEHELQEKVADAKGELSAPAAGQWLVSESLHELELGVAADVVPPKSLRKDASWPAATPRDWADAEIAIQQRSRAA
jgi:transcriptional regulator with XRE-family HTH domain